MSFRYPVFLDVNGIEVLVVGGGPVGLGKAVGLAAAGARVTVVSPDVVDGFDAVADRIELRRYRDGEAANYRLVMTATDDPAVNAQVAADAKDARVWANSADDPDNCSFILPAIARRGLVTVAVSTDGASPALASRVRSEIADRILTEHVEAAAAEIGRRRADIHAAGNTTEDVDWSDQLAAAFPTAPTEPSTAGRQPTTPVANGNLCTPVENG